MGNIPFSGPHYWVSLESHLIIGRVPTKTTQPPPPKKNRNVGFSNTLFPGLENSSLRQVGAFPSYRAKRPCMWQNGHRVRCSWWGEYDSQIRIEELEFVKDFWGAPSDQCCGSCGVLLQNPQQKQPFCIYSLVFFFWLTHPQTKHATGK